MKKLLAIALFSVFVSCTPGMHPEYEQNTETVKAFLKLQGEETDVNAQMALIHEDLDWQPAFHGSAPIGKEDFKAYLLNWQDAMEETVYTPRNYLPGVLADTGLQDGSVRSYGKWTGVHSATGKKWELTAYHTWDFKDGKIIAGGDYFDAGGLIASLKVEEVTEEITEE